MGAGDMTYGGSKIGCLSIGESGAYLIAACLPTYRSLFRAAKGKVGYTQGSKPSRVFPSSNSPSGKSTELSAISKQKGFSRLDNDKSFGVSTYQSSDEEVLVPMDEHADVERKYHVSSS